MEPVSVQELKAVCHLFLILIDVINDQANGVHFLVIGQAEVQWNRPKTENTLL